MAVDRVALGVAPTQAIAVPPIATAPTQAVNALATAPTEAIPIASLPTLPSAVDIVPGAQPPAPAPPPSRRVAFLVAAGVLVLAALAGVLFVIGLTSPACTGRAGRTSLRSRTSRSGRASTPARTTCSVRARARGDDVDHRHAGAGHDRPEVKLYRYPDVAQAERAHEALHAGPAAARDGKAVLQVALPSPAGAETLLARITR